MLVGNLQSKSKNSDIPICTLIRTGTFIIEKCVELLRASSNYMLCQKTNTEK